MDQEKKIALIEEEIKALPLVAAMIDKFEKELSPTLTFHSLRHTLNVFHESIIFGVADGLDARSLTLLGIAAIFHDSGFLQAPNPNELIGAEVARAAMRASGGYSTSEQDLVGEMIANTDTRSEANLVHSLAGYLLDADVSNFGRDDFFERSALFAGENGITIDAAYYATLLRMLERHTWYTTAAATLRQSQKEKNIEKLKSMLASA